MYTNHREIDEYVFKDILKFEELQLSKFKSEFDSLCISISKLNDWNYTACVYRWIDTADKRGNCPLDGYTATLQIDFKDSVGNMIEIDESICTFFENITYISFSPIHQRYIVFQNDQLETLRTEIKQFISKFE